MNFNKKMMISLAVASILAAGCSSRNNTAGTIPPSTNNNYSYSVPNEQIPPSYNNGTPNQNSGGRQPNENQTWDYAGGFSINELENALRQAGAITTKGEPYDVTGTNMRTATRYGNIVIGTYKEELVDEALEHYQKGSMKINGKEVKVVNMIGNFLLIVLEGEISQEAISAFSAVGGL